MHVGLLEPIIRAYQLNYCQKKLKLARHEYKVTQLDDMSFCHWMDTKPVMILSNIHDPAAVDIIIIIIIIMET